MSGALKNRVRKSQSDANHAMNASSRANRKVMPTGVLRRRLCSLPPNVVGGAYRQGMSKITAIRGTAARSRTPRTGARGLVIPWYSSGMTAKRKVSVSLDEDLVAELEAADEALSGQVNEAIRAEVERRRRNRLLTGMLDSLDAEYGPVDEALVAKYTELL
jgi:post-segregation antitoxin (ccd killing protein)